MNAEGWRRTVASKQLVVGATIGSLYPKGLGLEPLRSASSRFRPAKGQRRGGRGRSVQLTTLWSSKVVPNVFVRPP